MKLRIRGNSIRLRVTQGELQQIGNREAVSDQIRFGSNDALVYRLQASDQVSVAEARFGGQTIDVLLPAAQARHWAESNDVGISASQALDGDETLSILVEKDFACLQPRQGEDESDMFVNPDAGATC